MAQQSFIGVQELSKLFGISTERIRQLVKEGMPQEGRGRYDFVRCALWYIRFLQEAVKRRTQPGDVGGADALRKERAASLSADTELRLLALAERRRELVPVEVAARMFDEAVTTFRAKMLAGIHKTGIRVLGARTQAQANAMVEEVIHDALRSVAAVGRELKETVREGKNGRDSA